MIGSVSSVRTNIMEMPVLALPRMGGRKATYPVRPADAIVARFKHIEVEPDFVTRTGIPLYKLSALDNLIEALSRIGIFTRTDLHKADAASLDALVSGLSGEFRSRSANPFMAGNLVEKGLVVDLAA
jgi:hypothetical protein